MMQVIPGNTYSMALNAEQYNQPKNNSNNLKYLNSQVSSFEENNTSIYERGTSSIIVNPQTPENVEKNNEIFNKLFYVDEKVVSSIRYTVLRFHIKNMLKFIFLPIGLYELVVKILTSDRTLLVRALQFVAIPISASIAAVASLVLIVPFFILSEGIARSGNTRGGECKDLIKNLCYNICDNIEYISKNNNKEKITIDHKQRQQLISLISTIFLTGYNVGKEVKQDTNLFSEDFLKKPKFDSMIIKICKNLKLTEDFSDRFISFCQKEQEKEGLSSVQQRYFGMLEDAFTEYNKKI